MKECLFCKIMENEISSYTIYEDEKVKCFLDIHPDSAGHTLIVPKKHILDLSELDNENAAHINKIAKKLKLKMESKLNVDGLKLVQNNGFIQEVKHYHLHLIPFYKKKINLNIEEVYNKLSN